MLAGLVENSCLVFECTYIIILLLLIYSMLLLIMLISFVYVVFNNSVHVHIAMPYCLNVMLMLILLFHAKHYICDELIRINTECGIHTTMYMYSSLHEFSRKLYNMQWLHTKSVSLSSQCECTCMSVFCTPVSMGFNAACGLRTELQ